MKALFPQQREHLLNRFCSSRIATAKHLPYLRKLALGCQDIIELGVNRGASSLALSYCQGTLTSYEYEPNKYTRKIKRLIGPAWKLRLQDTRTVMPDEVPVHDLLFVDSLHTYEQVVKELKIFAPKTRRFIVFHDTITFAIKGADGETGRRLESSEDDFEPKTHGIRMAIDEFMIEHPEWRIIRHAGFGHGLLTLEKAR
jgi:predicted O-methyltransferase YrrM